VQAASPSADAKLRALRQATALANLTVAESEARLVLDWDVPLRHATFYKAVYRPAVLRANRVAASLPRELKFHALRHTYASLCVAAGIKPAKLSARMGHANIRATPHLLVGS
jgi:integrase